MLQTGEKHNNKKRSRLKNLVMEAPGNVFYLIVLLSSYKQTKDKFCK